MTKHIKDCPANDGFGCRCDELRYAKQIKHTLDERLIAAAPDMLAALQLTIRSRWLSIDVESNRTREACDIRSAICAAIDKATGAQ